jgi:hypothetical protein
MFTTDLGEPALIMQAANPMPNGVEAAHQAFVQACDHDKYCAIHDEYGTCTCGATPMSSNRIIEEE